MKARVRCRICKLMVSIALAVEASIGIVCIPCAENLPADPPAQYFPVDTSLAVTSAFTSASASGVTLYQRIDDQVDIIG